MTLNEMSKRKQNLCLILQYSVLFAILTAGVFAIFIVAHLSFISYGDPHKQGYFWTVELQENLRSFFAGEGFPHWSWSKGLGLEVDFPTDPFQILAALFPAGYIELGYTIAALLRMYCSGLFFLVFGRENGLGGFQVLMGSISYAFCGWIINMALAQAYFINATVMLPVLLLGVDRIYKGKSPLLFMLAVGGALILSPYLAYMCAIAVVIYILLRYFAYRSFHILDYLKNAGIFIVYGLVGIMISTAAVLFTVEMLQAASLNSATEGVDLFHKASYYHKMGERLLCTGLMEGYTYAGVPAFLLILCGVAVKKISRKSTPLFMSILLLIMSLFPFFGSMFNGFSYVSGRWFFLLSFFLIWTGCEVLDLKTLRKASNIVVLLILWGILALVTVGAEVAGLFDGGLRATAFMANGLLAALVMIGLAGIREGRGLTIHRKQIGMLALMVIAMVLSWNLAFYDNLDIYLKNNQENKQVQRSVQRAGAMIDDYDFYRIDQVDGINMHAVMAMQANESLWWKTRTIYLYDSKLPARWLRFNQLVGNNYGYSKRVYVQSNQNRMGLDFLYGVKYFLGNDRKNDVTGSSEYAGYGFHFSDLLDGVEVFENKYDPGLGFAYEKFLPESEFLKLSRLEREQALLQAAVIPDDQMQKLDPALQITASDIHTDIKEVPYKIVWSNGIDAEDNVLHVHKKYANMTLKVKGVEDSQLMISFDNLIRNQGDSREPKKFTLYVSNDRVSGNMLNDIENNQTIPGIRDYDFNMGYYDSYDGKIRLKFSRKGTYHFDRMYVSAMSADRYDRDAAKLCQRKLKISAFDDKKVEASVDLKSDGILFFSIPSYNHWNIYIDGKKADRITDMNIAFMGAAVSSGHHDIVLKYDFSTLRMSFMVSLIGLLIAVAVALIHWRRRKSKKRMEDE